MPESHSQLPRTRALLRFALLLVAVGAFVVLLGLNSKNAPAQSASSELNSKLNELENIQQEKAPLAASVHSSDAEINSLIGQISDLMVKQDQVQAELDEKQAQFEKANEDLAGEQDHLKDVRAHLVRATKDLRQFLIDTYKEGEPDITGIVLGSSSFDELANSSTYLSKIQDHNADSVDRITALRADVTETVGRLADVQQRISEARDAVAAKRDELAKQSSALASQKQELVSARAARESRLGALSDREDVLTKQLAPQGLGPGGTATLLPNGDAVPPSGAPLQVKAAIEAANQINGLPYLWGGGHGSFDSPGGYDCSGSSSFALHAGGWLSSPLDSTALASWGESGPGKWITVFANGEHAYMTIAGLRFDTGGNGGGSGPRFHTDLRDNIGFIARHPAGF